MAKIIAKKPITMQILGVQFKNGEATVQLPSLIEFFRSRHYTIIDETVKNETVSTEPVTPTKKSKKKVD